jgi:uncharacterized protein (TIGR03067 family)
MRIKLSTIAMFAAVLVFSGCKSKEQSEAENAAKKAEQDKLQGKWKITSRVGETEEGDAEAPEPNAYYTIEGDIMKFVLKGANGQEEVLERLKLVLMPDKDPKQVDMIYVDENGKEITTKRTKKGLTGKKRTSTTTLKDVAIYKLEGDKLQFNISFDDKKRPTDFTAPKGSSRYVLTLEKIKDKSETTTETPKGDGKKDEGKKDEGKKAEGKKDEGKGDKKDK